MKLKRTPLHRAHAELRAQMIDFAGWEMPVQYEGALPEHLAVRESAGLFDVSHMGRVELRGPDALATVQRVTCNDASRLEVGQAQYSAFLTPKGTFVDDVVVYRLDRRRYLICVNAANRDKDLQWILDHREGDVEVVDLGEELAQIALQGPASESVLQPLSGVPLDSLRFYRAAQAKLDGVEGLISRTGYTGEDGFELYLPASEAERIWNLLLEKGRGKGLRPAGLAARNTLRLEMRYPLYGHDIDDSTTPLEAGLGWIVKLEKGDFTGRSALIEVRERGPSRRLVGFELVDRGIPRDDYPVLLDGRPVGRVTSGSYSPSLKKGIGLVYLPIEAARIGQALEIRIRNRTRRAKVVQTPFYKPPKAR